MTPADNDALLALARVWKLDGGWMVCQGCKRPIIASRDGETMNHGEDCKHSAEQHPWTRLRAILGKVKPAKAPKAKGYTDEFEEAWAAYPPRPGSSKATAFKAWCARLAAGATAVEMIAGTRRYAAYCAAERTEPSYIKMAATFYGPGEHFSADWTVKNCRQSANDEAKRRLFGGGDIDAAG